MTGSKLFRRMTGALVAVLAGILAALGLSPAA